MFRYLDSALPPDFELVRDLKTLGYFINEKDQIRMIGHPESGFHYYSSKNERYIEQNRNSMDQCVKDEVMRRMAKLDYETVRLPLGTTADDPHIPILASSNIKSCDRVIVLFGERTEDLAVFSGHLLSKIKISKGCAEEMCSYIRDIEPSDKRPGMLIANPGQYIWWAGSKQAITAWSWSALPRKSSALPGFMMGAANEIPRNEGPEEHIQCVMDQVLAPLLSAGKKLDIIAIGDVCDLVIQKIQANWANLKDNLEAVVLCSGHARAVEFMDKDFESFWGKRARIYTIDESPVETNLPGRLKSGCNIYSCGAGPNLDLVGHEGIIVETWPLILKYFDMVHRNLYYAEDTIIIQEPVDDDKNENENAGSDEQSLQGDEDLQDVSSLLEENKVVTEEAIEPGLAETKDAERVIESESDDEDKSRKIGGLEALLEACKIEPEKKTKKQRRAERVIKENRHMFE